MAELNRMCSECETKAAKFACRCIFPPALIWLECIPAHITKNPSALHTQSSITVDDIEEAKQQKQENWIAQLKQLNKQGIQNYRFSLQERLDKFLNERWEQIDSIMTQLQRRADLLKHHVMYEKSQALERFDAFVHEFSSSDKYDYLVKGDGYLDFEQLVPLQFDAESPVEGELDELFDLREEITILIPGQQPRMPALPPPPPVPQAVPAAIPQGPFLRHQFDTVFVQEYFTFDNDNQIATLTKGQKNHIAAVRTSKKQSSANVKFKFDDTGYFGICRVENPQGLPGRHDSNAWVWNTAGNTIYANKAEKKWLLGMGFMHGKEIEMKYDGKAKRLQICCEGRTNTQKNKQWPEEVYFVFALGTVGDKIILPPR